MRTAVISILLLIAAWCGSQTIFLDPYRFEVPAEEPSGEYLTDRWYFSNVTETNDAWFQIGFVGAGSRIIDWGDGNIVTNSGTLVVSNQYALAASNIFSIRGSFTRVYWHQLVTRTRLTRILTDPNGCPDIDSMLNTFNECNGLIGSIPSLSNLTKLTSLSATFNGCFGLTGSFPDLSGLTNLQTIAAAFYNCTSLTGAIPDINGLTNLTAINAAFQFCSALTGDYPTISNLWKLTTTREAFRGTRMTNNTRTVADIFGTAGFTNLTTANQMFAESGPQFSGLLGSASDFTNLTFHANFTVGTASTNSSYRMFQNQTNLTDFATMDAAWK
jgi:hypothetical protein